jgi:hypothetical protein
MDFPNTLAKTLTGRPSDSFSKMATQLIGIACRKKGTASFKKELLDAGTIWFEYKWSKFWENAWVGVTPNVQSNGADVQALLRDGKWIELMGRGATVWEDK